MAEVYRDMNASPQEIFTVLADGWTYASWVVGASHMRDVDPHWPEIGARLHHRVGPWPLSIDDTTHVAAMEPDRLLELDAHVWPMGSAWARLTLEPLGADCTRVRFAEKFSSTLARRIPEPLQAALIVPRNRESLARLEDIAVRRVRAARR